MIETVLNQNNELLKLNHEIYNKNNVTHYQEKSIKECHKRNDFQIASTTATKKIKQSLEKDMDNSNNNNRFISPNRFGRLFYGDYNNNDNESVTINIDSTKTLQTNNNDQINKEYFARKYNNNDKNKNTGRPDPENQTVYSRKRIVLGTNSFTETLVMLVYIAVQEQHLINYFIIWMSVLINTKIQQLFILGQMIY